MNLKRSCVSGSPADNRTPMPKRRRSAGHRLAQVDGEDDTDELRDIVDGNSDSVNVVEVKPRIAAIASTGEIAQQTVAPFLARHIPNQYAPLGGVFNLQQGGPKDPNSRYCYRHRPDLTCRRQADEPSMDRLQKDLDSLAQGDRQGITHLWSLFSAAPAKQRNLMLQGVLAQCCFPQLSYLSGSIRELLKIDFVTALPAEISFKILCFLDTTSLCKAAQVSQRWRLLADDDVVWHRMCEQHIDRKCTRCGWGLPAVEQKRLRATKREIQMRAQGLGLNEWSPHLTPQLGDHGGLNGHGTQSEGPSSRDELADPTPVRLPSPKHHITDAPSPGCESELPRKIRFWKDVYKDRYKIGSNWKHGRCSMKSFRGHTNGVMCLQFLDNVLATGSYDTTIKMWDIESGSELKVLTGVDGHLQGVRCLQFDDTKLISGSLDSTLKVWNWRTGECLSTYRGHDGGVIGLHFDGDLLVSGSVDRTVKIWNFRDKSIFTLRGHKDWVNSVKLDMESRTLLSASDDLTVRLWDLDTKACLRILKGHVGQVQQVVPLLRNFEVDDLENSDSDEHGGSSQNSASSSPGATHAAELLANPPESEIFPLDPNRTPPPRYILTSALDSTIRLWDVPTGKCVRTFFGHVEGIWALAADSLRFASGAEDRMIKVWDARSGACEKTYTGHAGPVTCIALSSSRMCSGSEDGEVRMYNFKD